MWPVRVNRPGTDKHARDRPHAPGSAEVERLLPQGSHCFVEDAFEDAVQPRGTGAREGSNDSCRASARDRSPEPHPPLPRREPLPVVTEQHHKPRMRVSVQVLQDRALVRAVRTGVGGACGATPAES